MGSGGAKKSRETKGDPTQLIGSMNDLREYAEKVFDQLNDVMDWAPGSECFFPMDEAVPIVEAALQAQRVECEKWVPRIGKMKYRESPNDFIMLDRGQLEKMSEGILSATPNVEEPCPTS